MQFRTKARAVDLLGKGQIADLPTAITELWKNGYDAYADNLTAEIYLDSYTDIDTPLFIMTDDGKGMSRRDIFEKWLVLGTDSKSRAKLEIESSEETLWKEPRIKAGEKGIGRLSVAFLGGPMLMLTKKQGHELEALFFDWRLLENYNLFLDDVDIPVDSIDKTANFPKIFEKLKSKFLRNFEKENDIDGNLIWEESQDKLKSEIENSIKNTTIPDILISKLVEDLIDIGNHHGTKFIIFEPITQIIDLTNKSHDYKRDREFIISSLSGFTNDFKDEKNLVKTSIPVFYDIDQEYDFLTSEGKFFNAKDYDFADIVIEGDFDGEGSFNGKLKIYDEEVDHHFINPRKKDKRNNYGKVAIKLGYNQGKEKESIQSEVSYGIINAKVKNYGGLYIYRDGFRVLPYGRHNADFLRFEERRSRRAGSYYFSYRRMFGYLGLTRNDNVKLKDKSSREGLINNAAYRAFESDLIAFFIDLAKEYFSDTPQNSLFRDKKAIVTEQNKAISLDNKRAIQEKKAFTRLLNQYPKKLEEFKKEYQQLLYQLEVKTNLSRTIYGDIEKILDRLHTLDIEFKNLIPKIPKRYEPTETQLDRLEKYESKLIQFNESVKNSSKQLMLRVKEKLEIKDLKIDFIKSYQKYNGTLEKLITENRAQLKKQFDKLSKDFSFRTRRIVDDLNFDKQNIIASIDSKEAVFTHSEKLVNKFEFLREQFNKEILPLIEHLNKLSFDIDEELVQGAYRSEYETIKYKWEQTRDTAQLGMAVEIVDHEFNQLYAKINSSIAKLSLNNNFFNEKQFQFLKQNFGQLEDKYDLLSPLYRISGVIPKKIDGLSIYSYLLKFFENRFDSYNIRLKSTDDFNKHELIIKEPVIHTVYINIINNAIYWMRNKKDRQILLDYKSESDEVIICNSGFKIEEHRLEKIFEIFYSNRPNGRGIGLYLCKQSLNENRLDIYATNDKEYNALRGACFVITPLK